jgi:pimeloyl-ACP methyl ester carboxylesterase
MTPQIGTLTLNGNTINCVKLGHGPKLLLAFHGFDCDASMFMPLAEKLKEDYTTVAIDLPGHGQTQWKDAYFSKKDLMALVQGIKNDVDVPQIALCGYSLGARVCLNIVEQNPNWVTLMVLLAPDGIVNNFWYQMATRNPIGKKVFQDVMQQPHKWLSRFEYLQRWNIVGKSQFKFAQLYLTDQDRSKKVGYTWKVMSRLKVNLSALKWLMNKYKVRTEIFMGQHDNLFPPQNATLFSKRLKRCTIHVLDTGHELLNGKTVGDICKVF